MLKNVFKQLLRYWTAAWWSTSALLSLQSLNLSVGYEKQKGEEFDIREVNFKFLAQECRK